MDEPTFVWSGRRVLVTGGTAPLGAAVIRELLAGGSAVVALVRDRIAAAGLPRHIEILYGRAEDRFRVYSALAIHEIECVFHLDADAATPDTGTATVIEAVRLFNPRIPVVATANPRLKSAVPLGVVRLADRSGSEPICDLPDAARACLRLAEDLATRPEPRVEEIAFRAGWPTAAREPNRRAA